MKSRLNLTIDETLLHKVKGYATVQKTSVSELVENYFEHLTKPVGRKNILELVDRLPKHKLDPKQDLKKLYYENQTS